MFNSMISTYAVNKYEKSISFKDIWVSEGSNANKFLKLKTEYLLFEAVLEQRPGF